MANEPAARPTSTTFLRLAAGFIYFDFGLLKFFPDLSPAELLAGQTQMRMMFHWADAATVLWWLALGECLIGLCFLFNVFVPYMFFAFMAHQAATFAPLFLFPELTFKIFPLAPTLEGQYIMKNLISVAAGWTVMLPQVKAYWSARFAKAAASRPVAIAADVERNGERIVHEAVFQAAGDGASSRRAGDRHESHV